MKLIDGNSVIYVFFFRFMILGKKAKIEDFCKQSDNG